MEEKTYEIIANKEIAASFYELCLLGDTPCRTRPGQFVNIKLEPFYLRRPMSVCDAEENRLTLIYKTVGDGTKYMTSLLPGTKLNLLVGLGNGYDTAKSGSLPLLIGGGSGLPPLYLLAKNLIAEGKSVTLMMGFNQKEEIFYREKFMSLGAKVLVATADGSYGAKGFVTEFLPPAADYTYTYACGPEAMLKAVWNAAATSGEYSFESRMGCGFGACMGCSMETKSGPKRICREGPVFSKEEIQWPKTP